MKDVTIRQLEYFVAVAEERSITRAALKCHVTQAAISQALKELEAVLGVQLAIRRTAKGIHLTPTGRAVATRSRTLLGEVRHLVSTAEGTAETGTYTVGCFPTLSPLVIPELAEFVARTYPSVRLEIVEDTGPEIQERMMRGQVDLCFIYEAQRHPEASTVLLKERRFRVAVAADHPLARQDAVTVAELGRHPFALLNVEPATYLNEAMLRRFGVVPNVVYRSSNVHTIRSIVGRGLACALLMHEVAESDEGRPLRFLPIVEDLGTNSILAASPRGVRPSTLTAALVEHCQAALAS
ncbi:LysR family transcriptional regulator [Nocardiopsis suaedae]|uniref:LysR family transcriptional regulator n=1 Tax=Nocardiopsis suaedae TaxID=3018444 RepID=A0ABT4TKM5_9ACTN|nr:LysR family transcriptional regulator [Nocardiopsis suaedae]MDA2805156.1 LysR family transcriptional regulator [Nocardiopsis suaedae]